MVAKGRIGHGGYSRDYAIDIIRCACTTCPANARNSCSMPSAIILDASGRCTTKDSLSGLSKKPTRPLDGD